MDENKSYFNKLEEREESAPVKTSAEKISPQKTSANKGGFWVGLLLGILGMIVIGGAVYLGNTLQNYVEGRENGQAENNSGNKGQLVEANEGSAITQFAVDKLTLLEQTINQYYYLDAVTEEEMTDGVYKGLISALGDPYSEYYTAEELQVIMEEMEGTYYGIGAYVSLDTVTNMPRISGVIANSPAEEADLRADDVIYEIDGESTYGLSLTKAVSLIKGEEGTEVVLTIYRAGESDYLTIPLIRRKVDAPSIEYEMLENNMAYIQIIEFSDTTTDQFADALATMRGSGMEGLILDLRANPGGSLTAVVDMCRMILPEGLIVYTEDKYGQRVEYSCDGKRELEVPLVVLVDGNSASASEIMAGAIKDYELGTLVGTTTFGKGIVQQVLPFKDGSAVKLTVSSYYTPEGNNIHGTGIEPDIVCEFDGETYYNTEDNYDNQLERAKEVLAEKMQASE